MIENENVLFSSFDIRSDFPKEMAGALPLRISSGLEQARPTEIDREFTRRRKQSARARAIVSLAETLLCRRAKLNPSGAFLLAQQMYNETRNFLMEEKLLAEQHVEPTEGFVGGGMD